MLLSIFSSAYLHIYVSSSWGILPDLWSIYFIELLVFILNFKSSSCILDTSPSSEMFCKYFPQSVTWFCFFFFLNSIIWRAEVFNFVKVQLIAFIYFFYESAAVLPLRNLCLTLDHKDFHLFSFWSFAGLGFISKTN